MGEDMVITETDHPYLVEAVLFNLEILKNDNLPVQHWWSSKFKNNEATLEKFESDVWPGMSKDLRENKKWSQSQLDELLQKIKNPRRENLVETMASPDQQPIVVKESWNKDYDLNRKYTEKGADDRILWERPAVDETQQARWSDMIMDNWYVAAEAAGKKPNTLRYIGRHNVVTPETQRTFNTYLGDRDSVIIRQGDPGFEGLSNTMHTKPFNHMLADYPDLGPLEVT
ncbi:hypothetical protein K458DRAFT_407779 [Lentithecium fluviatile CBS 122367]|uniref:Uncharacterized protein n=1 Tax=Lentithecium fluviatile CBS 122367 TaxID=1168545 RepID=A0A6G1IPM4_9PLEO|nr:hypothetical protein K458DRAFT_407779 [Lentithecium fluviatile CBS 122367]